MVDQSAWQVVSDTLGWMYFLAWSLSFYPQAIMNYQMKSVAGFSLEYAAMNPNGYFFYCVYSVAGSIDPFLGTGLVNPNDLLFALHGFAMSAV